MNIDYYEVPQRECKESDTLQALSYSEARPEAVVTVRRWSAWSR